jgi:hypothetical protein
MAILLLIGCESKITAPEKSRTNLNIRIDATEASPKLLAAVDQYQVSVLDPALDSIVATTPLTLNANGFIVGQIDSLPAEIMLDFMAEATDAQAGLIFYGVTSTILEPDIINNVFINLSPVVPLMKFTPRNFEIIGTDSSAKPFDVKIFNVDSLYGISFRVRYDPNYLRAVNATLHPSQNPSNVIFFQFDSSDANGPYKAITVTETVLTRAIVDANGDGALCNISFALLRPFTLADSTALQIEPTGMTLQNQSQPPTSNLFTDDAFIRITP